MKKLKGILFDLDGVFYIEKTLISGGNKTLAFLRQEQIPFRFVTNNTTLSRSALTHKLQTLGLEVEEDQILSANYAGILQVKKSGFDRCRLLLRLEAQADYPPNIPERPDAIVIGDIGDAWNYDLLNDLMRQVLDGAEIVALHKGRYHEGRNGLQLDSGAFVAALEHATGKKAVVVGKPSKAFFTLASEVFSCSPEELIMIGDDLINDIKGAQQMGYHAILVQTGKYRKALVEKSEIKPDGCISSIALLPDYLRDNGLV
ncbi:MAG: TIGR01458 family HAD-type hydrolase [Flavobacteriaceae bacterium]|nr:TIGR01458 family HAD-type hydrolase [Flavobacteriaceae bacterium]